MAEIPRPQEQSAFDRAEIKIRLIENGVLVKSGKGWYTFETWEKASEHIAWRLLKLENERRKTAS